MYSEINEISELITLQKQEIHKQNLILDSLQEKRIRMIKETVHYYHFPQEMMELASSYNKDTTSKGDLGYKVYNNIKQALSEHLFSNRKISIINIMSVGYDTYAYDFIIQCKRYYFSVIIPDLTQFCQSNSYLMNDGKIAVSYQVNPSFYKALINSYDEEEIAAEINKFLDKGSENK